jgi:hypothetical protein
MRHEWLAGKRGAEHTGYRRRQVSYALLNTPGLETPPRASIRRNRASGARCRSTIPKFRKKSIDLRIVARKASGLRLPVAKQEHLCKKKGRADVSGLTLEGDVQNESRTLGKTPSEKRVRRAPARSEGPRSTR